MLEFLTLPLLVCTDVTAFEPLQIFLIKAVSLSPFFKPGCFNNVVCLRTRHWTVY